MLYKPRHALAAKDCLFSYLSPTFIEGLGLSHYMSFKWFVLHNQHIYSNCYDLNLYDDDAIVIDNFLKTISDIEKSFEQSYPAIKEQTSIGLYYGDIKDICDFINQGRCYCGYCENCPRSFAAYSIKDMLLNLARDAHSCFDKIRETANHLMR